MSRDLTITREALLAAQGQELGLSEWVDVGQGRIDAFAEVAEDHQFIHVDPVRAAQTPFGGTIAHGMLTLSIMSGLAYHTLPQVAGASTSINYGFDKVRFLAPVPVDSRLRARFVLESVDVRGKGDLMARFASHVEIDGGRRPVMTADWLLLYTF